MNPSLKLYFYSSKWANNNNILFKIYCKNIVVVFIISYFFILFFLSFFLFSSFFPPPHTYTHISPSSPFLLYFPLIPKPPSLFLFPARSPSFSLWGPTSLFSQSIPNFQFDSIPAHFLENHHSFNYFSITFKTFQIARIHSSLIYNSHFITS